MTSPSTTLAFDTNESSDWSLFVAGDASDRGEPGHFSLDDSLEARISEADCSLINLEAPIGVGSEPVAKSGPTLETSPEMPAELATMGFDGVTLANNHIMDYGADGLTVTRSACDDAALDSCGVGSTHPDALTPMTIRIRDTDVAVFSLCEREFGVATESAPGAAWVNHPDVDERIQTAAATHDVVIVVAHGGIEQVPFSPPQRQSRFREFIDLGADAVIGHHPHVPQGWERYDDRPIFYSLGNSLFEMSNPRTRWGLTVELEFAGGSLVGAELVPVELVDATLYELGVERSRDEHLSYLHRLAAITSDPTKLTAYWQEVAERVFLTTLGPAMRNATGATLVSILRNPGRFLRTHDPWATQAHRGDMLVLLNLTRNESLQSVIQTALEVRTDSALDHRTPAIRSEARELLERTTERPMYNRPPRRRVLFDALLSKLRREGRQIAQTFRGHLSPR